MTRPPYFELSFRPNVALVSVIRRFVVEFYRRFLGDADATSRVALATHELLENAVKFSTDGETTIRIEVHQDVVPHVVDIELRNRAEPQNIAAMREILDGVARAPDALAFYHQLLVTRAKVSDRSGGLGLARICAEAEMHLSHRVVDGDVTVIQARTSVGGTR
jgi:hypothetical protein